MYNPCPHPCSPLSIPFCPLKKIFLNLFLIGGELLYNVVLVSAVQQCESAISIQSQLSGASFSYLELPWGSPSGVGVAAALKLLWQVFSFLSALRAHERLTEGLHSLMTVTSLLIDTAGNAPFLRAFSKYLRYD